MTKNFKRLIIVLALSSASTHTPSMYAQLFSQSLDTTAIRFGVSGRWLLNRHTAAFDTLRGVSSCLCEAKTVYGNALSSAWDAGVLAEVPFAKLGDALTLGLAARALYSSQIGANLMALERKNNNTVLIQHSLNVQLSTVAVEVLASVRLLKRFSLYAGAQAALLAERRYAVQEQILEPNDITYASGERTFNAASGELPFVNPLQVSLVGGIAYELVANRQGTILPTLEAFYTYGLTSPVPGANWRISSLRMGLSLKFSPYRTTELTGQEVEERYQDSLREAKDDTRRALAEANESRKKELTARIDDIRPIFFNDDETPRTDIDAQNTGSQLSTKFAVDSFAVHVRKISVEQRSPLIPVVFFTENSSVVPSRYKTIASPSEAAKFSLSTPGNDRQTSNSATTASASATLAAYYHLMNIVAKRLLELPAAKLTLTGVALADEQAPERLAESRVAAVAAYFQNVWNVPAARIITKSRVQAGLGNGNSNNNNNNNNVPTAEREEMRRVEFTSSTPEILAPVLTTAVRHTVTPGALQLGLKIAAGQGLKQWELEITQLAGRESFTLASSRGNRVYPTYYLWDMRSSPPVSTEDVSVRLTIDDMNNNKIEAPIVSVKVQEELAEGRATVLGFWSADALPPSLSGIVQPSSPEKAIAETIRPRSLKDSPTERISLWLPASSVSTDASVLAMPNAVRKTLPKTLYDTTTPEGRLYNRAALIECTD